MIKSLLLSLGIIAAMPQVFAKDLIVYLSRSHNTEAVAKMIAAETGGDLVAIELEKPYPRKLSRYPLSKYSVKMKVAIRNH